MIGYLTLIVGLLAVVGSVWASLWLARRREIVAPASDAGEGLRRAAHMLGLNEVRESYLFQARILTAWGEINEFQINCELWEQVQHPFFRVTIGFPSPLRRGIRISRDAHGGLMQRVLDSDKDKDRDSTSEDILVQSKQDIDELRMFLQDDLRQPLERLAAKVNRMQMGDEHLYLYVKNAPDGAFCDSILRESMAVAGRIFNRAMVLGPSKKSTMTSSYGQAKSEMSRRMSDSVECEPRVEESRPTGRITLASMAAVSVHDVMAGDRPDDQADSIWAKKSVELQEVELQVAAQEQQEQEAHAVVDKTDRLQNLENKVEAKRALSSTLQGMGVDVGKQTSDET